MTRKHFPAALTACCLMAGTALWVGLAGCGSDTPGPQRAEHVEPGEGQPAGPEGPPAGEPSPGSGPELPDTLPDESGPAGPGLEPPTGFEPGPAEPTPDEPSPLEPFSTQPPRTELPGTELPGMETPGAEIPGTELPPAEGPPAGLPPLETPSTPPSTPADTPPAAVPGSLNVTSSAFQPGQVISKKYTGDGEDVSPPLAWSGLPAGTKQLALICDDPDAPRTEPWVHWVIYAIPPQTAGLPEGVPRTERLENPPGALQGRNSWPTDNLGYRGPAPPPKHDAHRYFFKLYALDTALALKPGLTKDELLTAIQGHVLAEGRLLGKYDR